jgi:Carboxypeptidase regulatory-like domain
MRVIKISDSLQLLLAVCIKVALNLQSISSEINCDHLNRETKDYRSMKLCTPRRISSKAVLFLFAIFCTVSLAPRALAQTGSITGIVTDATGAVVSGATVTLTANTTGVTHTAVSGGAGTYSLLSLQPSVYTLTVEKSGFQKAVLNEVNVTVGEVLPLNVKLEVGAAATEIDVSAVTQAPVETDTYQLSTIIDSKAINNLPLILRDPYQLVLLSPGVVTGSSSSGAAVNGARERNNNFMLDGSDNNDSGVPGALQGAVGANPDSAQEFRVITNNFDAEFGRNTGAIVDVITRSGSNQIHGDAYWFGRYNALGARDWFNRKVNPDGSTSPQNPYVRNQFGASVGGPIIKDKTFFFVNGEWDRFVTNLTENITVPTPAFRSGVYTYVGQDGSQAVDLTNVANANNNTGLGLNGFVTNNLYQAMPLPQVTNSDGVSGLYFFPSESRQNAYTLTGKVDHQLTNSEQVSLRYIYARASDPGAYHDETLPNGIGATGTTSTSHAGNIQLVSTIRPNLVNNLRGSYTLFSANFYCRGLSELNTITGGVDSFGNSTFFSMSAPFGNIGCQGLGDSPGQGRLGKTGAFTDGLSWVIGKHSFKFGGELRHISEDGPSNFFAQQAIDFSFVVNSGQFAAYNSPFDVTSPDFSTFENQIYQQEGVIDAQSQSQFYDKSENRVANDDRRFRQHEYGLYAQDSWKALPNLTLSYGLRWEFNGVPFEAQNNLSNLFVPANGPGPFTFTTVGPGAERLLYTNSWKLFEPRAGFSFDPFSDGKTAIRGGFGIFHDRIFGNLVGNLRALPPFEQSPYFTPNLDPDSGQPIFPNPNPAGGNAVQGTTAVPENTPFIPTVGTSATLSQPLTLAEEATVDPNLKMAANAAWNLGVQRELTPAVVLEVNYVGNHAVHVLNEIDGNAPLPSNVSSLVSYCNAGVGNPDICGGIGEAYLQGELLYYGGDYGLLPMNATGNSIFYSVLETTSSGMSNYNALQVQVTKRSSHGYDLHAAYTWSHALDNANDSILPGANGINRALPRDSYHLENEYGNSTDDERHIFSAYGTWELPIGHGRSYLNRGLAGRALEGVQISGITKAGTGLPFEIFGTIDNLHTGVNDRASRSGSSPYPSGQGPSILPDGSGKRTGPAQSAFVNAPFDVVPTVRRNQFYGPNQVDTDAVFEKDQTVGERFKVIFRAEFYNVFNHPLFLQPASGTLGDPNFGVSTGTQTQNDGTTTARQIQGSLKLVF